MMHWRPMRAGDLPQVMAIADRLHPGYPERREIFADKLAFYPDGCQVLAADDAVFGYGFAHVWSLGLPPLLDTPLGALPAGKDCLHLHDVALMPQAQGAGRVDVYLDHLQTLALAASIDTLTLIAIAGKDKYWRGKGFLDFRPGDGELQRRLDSYGSGNLYLCRRLTKLKESDT
jgi:hypothetical protein